MEQIQHGYVFYDPDKGAGTTRTTSFNRRDFGVFMAQRLRVMKIRSRAARSLKLIIKDLHESDEEFTDVHGAKRKLRDFWLSYEQYLR